MSAQEAVHELMAAADEILNSSPDMALDIKARRDFTDAAYRFFNACIAKQQEMKS